VLEDWLDRPICEGWVFLAYLRSVIIRPSIGGYVKSVQVDDMTASGDVAGMRLGLCWESCSVSSSKKVSTVGGHENVAWVVWSGVCRAETEFLSFRVILGISFRIG
jgi:hypothetical protein